ncbi:MAG: carbohydrate kinase [Bifidobacteriaceae bacterium]|jgi:fructokinase|nr:carbohydrate kinase [Bifidobacteriaceae bacterium]
MTAPTALVLGEALIDIVRKGTHETEHAGGSPMNVAVGLGRLGIPTTLGTWIGKDQRGEVIRQHCAASDVHLVPGSDAAVKTPTAMATIDDAGQAQYTFDLSWELPKVPKWLSPAVIHTGSIAAVLEPGGSAVLEAIRAGADRATITYDPNMRPQIMGSSAGVNLRVEELISLADLVKVSDQDMLSLFPDGDMMEEAAHWLEQGPSIVIVTKGGDGAVAVTASGLWVEIAPQPAVVVDTVGAGDSFMSGVIWALAQAGLLGAAQRQALRQITEQQLRLVMEQAAQIAAITVSRAGANPPRLAELRR